MNERDSSPTVRTAEKKRKNKNKKRENSKNNSFLFFFFSHSDDNPVLIIQPKSSSSYFLFFENFGWIVGSVSARETVVLNMNISQPLSFSLFYLSPAGIITLLMITGRIIQHTLSYPQFATKMSAHIRLWATLPAPKIKRTLYSCARKQTVECLWDSLFLTPPTLSFFMRQMAEEEEEEKIRRAQTPFIIEWSLWPLVAYLRLWRKTTRNDS